MTNSMVKQNLFFTIQVNKQEYRTGESIKLTGSLENVGKESLLINKQFLIKSSEVERREWGIAIKIIVPSGKKLDLVWFYEMEGPAPHWFIRLEPGEKYSSNVNPDIGEIFNRGIVTKQDFSGITNDIDGLWKDLLKNWYINNEGIVQAKFNILKEASEMKLRKPYTNKSEAIYSILQHPYREYGIYHITAYYYNYIGKKFGLDPWMGVVESNTLEIKITP